MPILVGLLITIVLGMFVGYFMNFYKKSLAACTGADVRLKELFPKGAETEKWCARGFWVGLFERPIFFFLRRVPGFRCMGFAVELVGIENRDLLAKLKLWRL